VEIDYVSFLTRDLLVPYDGNNVPLRIILAFIVGSCVGSFLNVVALRSLEQRSWLFPGSACTSCKHSLGPLDMIPIFSYFLLKGKCRHCQEKFSWHYPVVEAVTGIIFAAVLMKFGYTIDGLAMCFFAATLITVTVTDFREHLIPHEITYPSILIGLAYFSLRHGSPADALIGAGVSYILFDFIDFYGQVVIGHVKGDDDDGEPTEGASAWVTDHSYDLKEQVYDPDDDIVMGGGDAVLSAVIACWIGWQQMAMAVVIAFLAGSLMGAIYLLRDMQKRDVLKNATMPAVKGFLIGACLLAIPLVILGVMTHNPEMFMTPQLLILASLSGIAGGLFGAVMSGTKRFTNRFPFGPALAIGGLVAILVANETWYFTQPMGISLTGGGL
jgi:prepilin signal peptidase PulO-like enzyme (type II secretory pathway)